MPALTPVERITQELVARFNLTVRRGNELWEATSAWRASQPLLISDLILPFFAILVPTMIAIWLARSERRAASLDRAEESARREQERVERGLDDALAAYKNLISAGYTDDFRLAAQIRIRAAAKLSSIRMSLGEQNTAAWDWIARELGIIAQGLEVKDATGMTRDTTSRASGGLPSTTPPGKKLTPTHTALTTLCGYVN